ncbi:hypothetical protein [Halomontanus rarus]|uniref:hypothetical protein n=1 Tax=Halomontanus rarus TaxID=3034020 RepID=UPI001A9939D5
MRTTKICAALLALLLVTSSGAAALGSSGGVSQATADDPDTADEVYVEENGDAVLVYEENHEEDFEEENVSLSGDFGFDTSTGLIHLFYEGEFADLVEDGEDEPEWTGDATARMTPDLVSGDVDVAGDAPEEIEDFSATVDHTQTHSTYESSTDFSMTVQADNESDEMGAAGTAGAAGLYSSVEFEADTTTSASTLESSGTMTSVTDENATFGAAADNEELLDVSLTETDGDYDLSVTEETTITEWQKDRWDTREDAAETLESRYNGMAMQFGGTMDFSLESYEFEEAEGENETHSVAVEYDVTFSGVKEQVSEMLADELADDQELDLSEAEAKSIADSIAALQVEKLEFSTETDGLEESVEWDVEIDNYDEFVLGLLEISESIDELDDQMADQLDETRDLLEAQNEADLVQQSSIEFSAETNDGETTVEFSSESSADNWADYVDEAQDRGLGEYLTETTTDLEIETVDDDLEIAGSFEVEHEGMLEMYLDDMIEQAENDPTLDDEFTESVQSFKQTEFETAKVGVSLSETTFSVESAAQFGNLSAPESENLTITAVHGETESNTTTMYVSVSEFVGEDPSEDEVRASEHVDEDTDVYMPGEGDRDFPETDVDSVSEFLEEEEDDSLLPVGTTGIAIGAVAVLAVVGGAVAFRRFS